MSDAVQTDDQAYAAALARFQGEAAPAAETESTDAPQETPAVETPETPESDTPPEEPKAEAPDDPPEETEAPDPWAGVPEKVKQSFEDLEHKLKSVHGRLAPTQQQLEELRKRNEALERQLAERSKAEQAEAEKARLSQPFQLPADQMAALKDTNPEAAAVIEALTNQIRDRYASEFERLNERTKPQDAETPEAPPATEPDVFDQVVSGVYPDWRETVKAPDFVTWLGQQNDEIKALYVDDNPASGVRVLKAFEQHQIETKLRQEQAAALQAKRQQRTANADVEKPSAPDPTPSAGPLSDDEAYAAAVARFKQWKATRS